MPSAAGKMEIPAKTDADWTEVARARLLQVMRQHGLLSPYRAAKLTDQALLVELAKTNDDPYVRWAAICALRDRTPLMGLAATDETRHDAVGEHRRNHAASDLTTLATELDKVQAEVERERVAEHAVWEAETDAQCDRARWETRAAVEAEATETQSAKLARVRAEGAERLATKLTEARAEAERHRIAEAGRLETEAASKRDSAAREAREAAEAEAATVLRAALALARVEADRTLATELAKVKAEVERERVAAHARWEAETEAECERAGREARSAVEAEAATVLTAALAGARAEADRTPQEGTLASSVARRFRRSDLRPRHRWLS